MPSLNDLTRIVEHNAIRYTAPDGATMAEITFPERGDGKVTIDHTFVDPAMRGQGMAGTLMDACVHELERTERLAHPTCSYALAWFEKHPEWQHLLAPEEA